MIDAMNKRWECKAVLSEEGRSQSIINLLLLMIFL